MLHLVAEKQIPSNVAPVHPSTKSFIFTRLPILLQILVQIHHSQSSRTTSTVHCLYLRITRCQSFGSPLTLCPLNQRDDDGRATNLQTGGAGGRSDGPITRSFKKSLQDLGVLKMQGSIKLLISRQLGSSWRANSRGIQGQMRGLYGMMGARRIITSFWFC